ncbi:DNA polymerase III subunit beta [Streptomyces sp. NBC_01571]|uniref:DNA polymerase III subunit beta n=1 Tax=Streptomyces sp. NBC_01571 TaxID=2975883 RepID=UPI00224D73E7|nr:DNA polymerase III subunit beta [Streptomyces sp. NBC_01571]MCX4581258.1 DNA polymerase III subunit beta [Streptomyces sp. NBC_01571]
MKLTIDTGRLAEAAQWALRAVPQTPPAPVLAGLLIEARDDTLTLSGFDYYRSAGAREDCDIEEPGVVLVGGRVFTDLVKGFPKSRATTLVLDGSTLTLSCGTAHINLPTLPLDEYPALPPVPAPSGTVTGTVLADAATHVAAAASTDDTLPMLTGVQFALGTDTLTLSATDRYRFHVAEVPWTPAPARKGKRKTDPEPHTEGFSLVPADILRDAARVLADTDQAQITFTDGQFAVSVPGRWATGRVLDGRLPDYQFPTEDDFESVVTVSTEALADAIKHVQPLLGKSDPIVLDITGDRITVRAGTDDKGRGSDQVPADLTGPTLDPAFNPGYFLQALQQVDAPHVQLNFASPTKPCLLHAPDQAHIFKALLMPIRVTPPSTGSES